MAIRSVKTSRILLHATLTLMAVATLFPILWLFCIAFKPLEDIYTWPPKILPSRWTLENMSSAFVRLRDFKTMYMNSILITSTSIALILLIGSLAGYALSRMRFPGRDSIFLGILIFMFVPKPSSLGALYELAEFLRLLNTRMILVLVYASGGVIFSMFLMRQVFLAVPRELEDAAVMDGCGDWRIFSQIMLPLSKSGLVTVAIFQFVGLWGEYIIVRTLVLVKSAQTLGVGLQRLIGSNPAVALPLWSINTGAAASVLATMPVVVVFVVFQKWFVRGITRGIKVG